MEFTDLTKPFTEKQNIESFLYLQNYMLEQTKKKQPFFIGRLSGNEPNLCGKVLTRTNIDNRLLHEMLTTAGIQMKSNDDIKQYVKLYNTSCKNNDILSVWSGGMYSQAKPREEGHKPTFSAGTLECLVRNEIVPEYTPQIS